MFFSLHALKRMAMRNITKAEIGQALANVDTTYPSEDSPDDRVVVLRTTDAGRRLKIVVEAADREAIITAADRDQEA